MNRSLASDNHSFVHPEILKSLTQPPPDGSQPPAYGMDSASIELQKKVEELFGGFQSFLVFNGTAANVIGLSTFTKSYQSVLCADISHLQLDECGAPEKIGGFKLIGLQSHKGKLKLETLQTALTRLGDQHHSQAIVVSLTQPTELGTVYTMEELAEISNFCKKNKLYLHCDGARFSNACFYLGVSLKEMAHFFDVMSFGGTKNGLLFGELILIKNSHPEAIHDVKFYRKQFLNLASKSFPMAQQFLAYFNNDLFYKIAKHSCTMALEFSEKLSALGFLPEYPVESNAVFLKIKPEHNKALKKIRFYYVWDPMSHLVRLMTSFETTHEDIHEFCVGVESLTQTK